MESKDSGRTPKEKCDAMSPVDVNTAEVKRLGQGTGFRQRVVEWLEQKGIFRTYRNTDTGWDIRFSRGSTRDVMAHSAGDGKVALLEHAPVLIKNGVFLETARKDGRGLESHIFAAKATIDGESGTIGMVVRQDSNGNRYYDHVISVGSGSRAETSLHAHTADGRLPDNPNSIHNILKKHLAVNT
jgi:hypothetical protein